MDCEELELMEDGGGFSTDESVPDEQPPNRTVKYAHNDSIDSDHREVVYVVDDSELDDEDISECNVNKRIVHFDSHNEISISINNEEEEFVVISECSCDTTDDERKIKSVVIPLNHIFASDGVVGALDSSQIKYVIRNGGYLDDVITTIKQSLESLRKIIILSAGNEDVATTSFSLSKFKRSIRKFKKEVEGAGGVLLVSSLVPRPLIQDPKISKKSEDDKEVLSLSQQYLAVNDFIFSLNLPRRTPMFKQYVESSTHSEINERGEKVLRKDKMFYKYRQQRKIKLNCFMPDHIHLKEKIKEKLLEVCKAKFDECEKEFERKNS